jgi:hypothetical protein
LAIEMLCLKLSASRISKLKVLGRLVSVGFICHRL